MPDSSLDSQPRSDRPAAASLSVRDHMTLRLAFTQYRYEARRESDAREMLGYSPTTFWLMIDRLIDNENALAAYPVEVGRLRRVRAGRKALRSRSRTESPAASGARVA